MKGALWRLLIVNYEDIILPSIKDNSRKLKLHDVYSCFAEILCIAYAEPAAQKQKCVRLRLHVLCFLLGIFLHET